MIDRAMGTVTFVVGEQRVALTPEGPWRLGVGHKPAVNRAIAPAGEFSKLAGKLSERGRIDLDWRPPDPATGLPLTSGPGSERLVRLHGWRVVSVEVAELGILPGKTSAEAVAYRLFFADVRERFESPRGGRLNVGIVNPTEPPGGDDPPPTARMTRREMIDACLAAMGLPKLVRERSDDPVDATDPPKDVEWRGEHAPAALAELLDDSGLVFAVGCDGTTRILPAAGREPELPADALLADTPLTGLDRRGKVIVISSDPVPEILTWDTAVHAEAAFRWVMPVQGGWVPIEAWPYWQGRGPVEQVQKQYADVDPAWAAVAAQHAYRCLQLSPAFADGFEEVILPRCAARGSEDQAGPGVAVEWQDLEVLAAVPRYEFGQWKRVVEPTRIPVQQISPGNVLILAQQVGRLAGGKAVGDMVADFEQLPASQVQVRFAITAAEADEATGVKRPKAFAAAFAVDVDASTEADGLSLAPMDADEAMAAVERGEGVVLSFPDLQLHRFGELELNGDVVRFRAEQQARRYAEGIQRPPRIAVLRGWHAIDPGGPVTEVSWDLRAMTTTVRINDLHRPGSTYGAEIKRRREERKRAEKEKKRGSPAPRLTGGPRPGQPAATIAGAGSPPPATGGVIPVMVTPDGGADGTVTTAASWTYKVAGIGGSPLGEKIPLAIPRPNGSMVAGTTWGLAFMTGSGVVLLDAGERPQTGSCDD